MLWKKTIFTFLESNFTAREFIEKMIRDIPLDVVEKFGYTLFGDFQNKKEEDTDYEYKIFTLLQSWLGGEQMGKQPKREFYKVANELMKLKSYYPDVLESQINTLYRLSVIEIQELGSVFHDFEKIGKKWYSKNTYIYNPHNKLQSWTTSEGVGFGFMNKPVGIAYLKDNLNTPILYKAIFSDDELLFNHNFLNKVSFNLFGMRQNEVIHIGKKPIEVQYIMNEKIYDRVIRRMNYKGKFIIYNGLEGVIFNTTPSYTALLENEEIVQFGRDVSKKIRKDEIKIIDPLNSKHMRFFKVYFRKHPELYFQL